VTKHCLLSAPPALVKLRLIVLGCYAITWHVFSWCANTCRNITDIYILLPGTCLYYYI